MKSGWTRLIGVVGIAAIVVFVSAGASFAGGYGYGPPHGPAYGHYRGWDHHPHYYAPGYYRCPPVVRYPVVVAPGFYPAPPPPVYPAPGFFFGMAAPGVTFGIGVH